MNDRVRILKTEILSDNWYTLKKLTYDYLRKNGTWTQQNREAYDRGNGATILLYNVTKNGYPNSSVSAPHIYQWKSGWNAD